MPLKEKIYRVAETWFESPGGATRLLPMEGLRGLAVLLVFLVHAHALFGSFLPANTRLFSVSMYLGGLGNVGVDLFFALSGFLIYGALLKKRITYLPFLRRRVRRIYPAFLVVLSFYLAMSIAVSSESKLPSSPSAAVKSIVENLLLLPGIFPITPIVTVAWSLSFEFAFYLFIPVAVLLLRRDSGSRIQRLVFIIALAIAFSLSEAFFLHGAQIRMLSFFSGMLLQELSGRGWARSLLSRAGQWGSIFALLLLAGYHFALQRTQSKTHSGEVLCVAMLSVAILFCSFHALEYPGALQKLCIWRPMRYWGNISYSYYLTHGLALKGVALLLGRVKPYGHPLVVYCSALALGLTASLAIAVLLYGLVERPLSLAPKKQRASTNDGNAIGLSEWIRAPHPVQEASCNR